MTMDDWNAIMRGTWLGLYGALVAAAFGFVRYIQTILPGPNQTPFSPIMMAIKMVSAGATGFVTTWLLLEWSLVHSHPYLAGVLIAVSGWGGVEFIDAIKAGALKFLKLTLDKGLLNEDDEQQAPKP